MEAAIGTGWYDFLMPAYQIQQREEYMELFRKCQQRQIGIVAMKTKISPGKPEHVSVILKDRELTTICRTMSSVAAVNGYIESLGSNVSAGEALRLINRESLASVGRCTMCGRCSLNCPGGLAVSDMVRCVDYYVDAMDDLEIGRENYLAIDSGARADNCVQCGTCEGVCPNDVPVKHHVRRSKKIFS